MNDYWLNIRFLVFHLQVKYGSSRPRLSFNRWWLRPLVLLQPVWIYHFDWKGRNRC